jgi:hypothetical protein
MSAKWDRRPSQAIPRELSAAAPLLNRYELFLAQAKSDGDGHVMKAWQQRERPLSGMPSDYAVQVEGLSQREVGAMLKICANVLRFHKSLIALEGSPSELSAAVCAA